MIKAPARALGTVRGPFACTNSLHRHKGGYPSHAERRTAEAHTGTTCSSACDSATREGVCSQLHKGRGATGGCVGFI